MKKKGMRWKKFANLEKEILEIIESSKTDKTTGEIQKDLEKKGIITSWNTTKDYLEGLYVKKKIKKAKLGTNRTFLFWGKL